MRLFYLFALSTALLLSACGGPPAEKARALLDEGKAADALKIATRKLKDNPRDASFNALAAEARLMLCFKQDCFSNPEDLKPLVTNLALMASEESAGALYQPIWRVINQQPASEQFTSQLLTLYDNLPTGRAQEHLQDVLFGTMEQALINLNTSLAQFTLNELLQRRTEQNLTTHFMGLLAGFLEGDVGKLNTRLAGSRAVEQQGLSPALIQLLPTAMLIQNINEAPTSGAEAFARNFNTQLEQLAIPALASDQAKIALAEGISNLKNAPRFAEFVSDHQTFKTPPPAATMAAAEGGIATPTVEEAAPIDEDGTAAAPVDPFTDPVTILKLYLTKQQLALVPSQQTLWQSFMPLALDYTARSGAADLLAGLDRSKIPASAVETYNARLFELAEANIARGQNVLPILEQVIIPEEDGRALEREQNRLLRAALDAALKAGNTQAVIDYANFNPEVARQVRQNIVTLVIKEIDAAWETDRFDDILALTEFMVKGMEVEFNLDGLLLKNFDNYLKAISITEITRATSATTLLEPQKEVQLDLGPKFGFLQEYFSTNPAVIDTQLKNIVVKAEGVYGPATTLYRVLHLFDDQQFPPEEREGYLVTAIKNSLREDKNLSGAKTLSTGYALHKSHQDLTLAFVINLSLDRLTNLQEGRELWAASDDTLKTSLIGLKPQFAALMQGIDAMEDEDFAEAAELFAQVNKPAYLQQAEPYLKELRALLHAAEGVYITATADQSQPVLMLVLTPQRAALPSFVPSDPSQTTVELKADHLTGMNVTALTAVGTMEKVDSETYKRSWGSTTRSTRAASYNPDSGEIELALNGSDFANRFGHLNKLQVTTDKVIASLANGSSAEFELVNRMPSAPIFPQGRFGITKQISEANSATDHLLPVGAIMELKVNTKTALQPEKDGEKLGIIYPVAGILRHPASATPLAVEGFFDATRNSTNLRYTYPFGTGGSEVEARLRCQIAGATLRCAGHNRHWDKVQYNHVVVGRRAAGGPAEITAEASQELTPVTPLETPSLDSLPTGSDGGLPADILDFPDLFE